MTPRVSEIIVAHEPFSRSVAFLLIDHGGPRPGYVTDLIVTVPPPEDVGLETRPSFRVNEEAAQSLMDGLWRAGLRPTEGSGSAGSLAATQDHLKDMRRIAFQTLGMKDQQ